MCIRDSGTSGSLDLAKGYRVVAQQPEIVSTSYADEPSDESDWPLAQAQEFVDAIGEHREPNVTPTDTAQAMGVVAQILESAKSQQVIGRKEGN